MENFIFCAVNVAQRKPYFDLFYALFVMDTGKKHKLSELSEKRIAQS